MDNRVLAQVLEEFDRLRQENEREEARRREQILSLHPDIAALVAQRHALVMGTVRGAFSGGAPGNAEARMAEYNQKIAGLLIAKGYPADYLAPVQHCSLCGDTGYLYENSVKKPCACLRKAYIAALSRQGEALTGEMTFENYDAERFPDTPLPGTEVTQREYMELIRKKCRAYADGIPGGPVKTLLLHGGSGLGKTYLLHCVENAVRAKGGDALYVTAYDLLMALKSAHFSRNENEAGEYFDAGLLLIDDLGMEPVWENLTVELIFNLMNARLSRGQYTALSTNLSRTELKARYTERLSSRLLDTRTGLAIPFQGKDIRLLRNDS